MHLLNILLQLNRKSLLILILGIVTSTISLYPLIVSKGQGVFYSIDPDVVYVANALSYIKTGQIHYIDHPGTPAIIGISTYLLPLRLYSKIVENTSFIPWSFSNFEKLYIYLRVCQVLTLGLGVVIFLFSIFRLSRSLLVVVASWLLLLSYSQFLYFGTSIIPETFSFLLVSVWVAGLVRFLETRSPVVLLFMSVVSGFSMANKFTNAVLPMATVLLAIELVNMRWIQKVYNGILSAVLILIAFVIGTWPIHSKYPHMVKWLLVLSSTTEAHGNGKEALFDAGSYLASINTLLHLEPWLVASIVLLFLIIGSFFIRRIDKIKGLFVLSVSLLVSLLLTAKYPLSHYQVANFSLSIVLMSMLLTSRDKMIKIVVIVLLIPGIFTMTSSYIKLSSQAIKNSIALDSYANSHVSSYPRIWEWARSKEFSLIWTNQWGNGIYNSYPEIKKDLPISLFSIKPHDINTFCWDQLYLQSVSLLAIEEAYPSLELSPVYIEGSDKVMVSNSNHCTTKP